MERARSNVDDPPDGSVCSVRNKKPRMSESAILVTQFLFAVVLEMTCNSDTVITTSNFSLHNKYTVTITGKENKELNTQRKAVLMFSNIRNG